MPQQNWKALQKNILEKAEKGDNQYSGKTGIKNNQDLETTRRSYATRRLKISEKYWIFFGDFMSQKISLDTWSAILESISWIEYHLICKKMLSFKDTWDQKSGFRGDLIFHFEINHSEIGIQRIL